MKHRIGFNDLSRSSSQRKALKRNMVTSLFRYERIETTNAKALEVRKMAEKMITRAKNANAACEKLAASGNEEDLKRSQALNVHAHRMIARDIYDEAVVAKLFTSIAPLFKDRDGGYTRILKTGNRLGDAADMVILELVEKTAKPDKKDSKKDSGKKKGAKKSEKSDDGKDKASKKRPDSKVKETKAVSSAKSTTRKAMNANKAAGK